MAETDPSEWTDRLQAIVNDTIERSTASTANLQRVLASSTAPGVDTEALAAEVTRHGTEHGAEAYRRLSEASARFVADSMRLTAQHLEAYLRRLVPDGQLGRVGPPPTMPVAPVGSDPTAWSTWYPRWTAWVADQQRWSAALLAAIRDEVAAGRLESDALQASARAYLQERLPEVLVDMAELNAELVAESLAVADESLNRLSEALSGGPGPERAVVDVSGRPGETVAVALMAENDRDQAGTVTCWEESRPGFAVRVEETELRLEPGASARIAINVTLPPEPTDGAVEAGTVTIRGQGERDLVMQVMAEVEAGPDEGSEPAERTAAGEPGDPGDSDEPGDADSTASP